MKEILCFGDSNTYGLIPGTKNRYGRDTRWTGLIEQQLYGKGCRIIEEGLCGRTTVLRMSCARAEKVQRFADSLESHAPVDRVVLMLGTNDCKTFYNASAEVIGLGVERLVEQIRKADKNIRILLISPIQLGEGVWEQGMILSLMKSPWRYRRVESSLSESGRKIWL